MPNWVFNSLVVSGDQVSLDAMREQLNKPITKNYPEREYNNATQKWESVPATQTYSNPVFAFWNVIAPTNLESYYGEETEKFGLDNFMEGFNNAMAKDQSWYWWNNRNWGTKWDVAVSDDDKYPETTLEVTDDGDLMYRFSTAWSPVENVILRLSEMYPSLEFDYEYEEEQGWGGEMVIRNGEVVSSSAYDIPSSHADYVARDRECVCEYNDIEYAYQDCPVDTSQYEWDEDSSEWVEKDLDNSLEL
jgi:hypothetical protein